MNYSIKKIEKKKRKIEEEYYFPKTSRKQKKIQVEISNIIELHLTNWFNRYCVNKPCMEIRREGNSIAGRDSRRPILKSRDPTIRSPADPARPTYEFGCRKVRSKLSKASSMVASCGLRHRYISIANKRSAGNS